MSWLKEATYQESHLKNLIAKYKEMLKTGDPPILLMYSDPIQSLTNLTSFTDIK